MGILSANLNNINLDDNNYKKMILILLFISDLWLGIVNLKNEKHLKKISEELMQMAWHPKRWWNFSMLEVEK